MREIKFRAWLKDEGYMIDIEGINFDKNGYEIYHENLQMDCITDTEPLSITDPITSHHSTECDLMQFTGLKDKNGKEIYEGDIVKDFDDEWDRSTFKDRIQLVEFGEGSFLPVSERHYSNFKVIGNKFENPELLK